MAVVIPIRSPKCLKSPGGRRKNHEVRSREHLMPDEVERMIAAARQRRRYGVCGKDGTGGARLRSILASAPEVA